VLTPEMWCRKIKIWTAQHREKLGQFNNFQTEAARKLKKSGRNLDRFYKFPTQKVCPGSFLKCPELGIISRKSGQVKALGVCSKDEQALLYLV
jgi:hypothetical protein